MDKVDYYITDDKLENRRNGEISRRLRRRGERRRHVEHLACCGRKLMI